MHPCLTTFLTLCRTMHYRQATEQLHLTQPAVTKQIQSLEAQYDVKLFRYDGRRLFQTEQGETLERYAISLQYNDAELVRAADRRARAERCQSAKTRAAQYAREFLALP